MASRMTAKVLVERLRASLVKPGDDMPGGMFMTEVALGSRRIDGLYCGFFGSRGRYLRGYEVKVARSDWLAELDQPAKAETWEQNVHEWWIVAPDTSIVRPEELPHGWGLIVPDPNPRTKTRMNVVVKAARHEDRNPSWEATHAIIQKADSERMRAISERVRALQDEHRGSIDAEVERRLSYDNSTAEHWKRRAEATDALLAEVTEILGIRVVDGEYAWGSSAVSVKELRESFGRYLIAGKQVDAALQHKLMQIRAVRDAATAAEKAIKAAGVSR
ncbi:hypothetical protein [Microbacterium kunmingense]|uniref:hypothetical protein n=1 Tax=Microbacterium kunmingense TaxID=2915939 RepID=UPI0020034EEF|nr:hypothetical protein [Microbacterium kunmingense]